MYKSTNGGDTWAAVNTDLADNNYVRAFAIDPSRPSTLYAAPAAGVLKSTDGGSSWAAVNTGLQFGNASVRALAIDDRTTPSTLYVGADIVSGGVFKSTDMTTSWQALNAGLPDNTSVNALASDPTTPSTLYAGTYRGVYKSTDGGRDLGRGERRAAQYRRLRAGHRPHHAPHALRGDRGRGARRGRVQEHRRGATWSAANAACPILTSPRWPLIPHAQHALRRDRRRRCLQEHRRRRQLAARPMSAWQRLRHRARHRPQHAQHALRRDVRQRRVQEHRRRQQLARWSTPACPTSPS